MQLDVPEIEVDTSDDYRLAVDEIVAFVPSNDPAVTFRRLQLGRPRGIFNWPLTDRSRKITVYARVSRIDHVRT